MKFEYDMSETDDYVDIWVPFSVRKREWEMHMFRSLETMAISEPRYSYSPNDQTLFEDVERIPKRVQRYFDAAMPKVKTLLILGSN